MARLVPTVRDPDRFGPEYTALVPTRRPPAVGTGPAGDEPSATLAALPEELSGYQLECWLDVGSAGEVERVGLVHKSLSRTRRIVKIYRPGAEAGSRVHDAWRAITHRGVVALHDAGMAAGRRYEVMDDVGDRVGGPDAPLSARRMTLRDLLVEHPGGLEPAQVEDLVRQLSEAIAAIGRARLAHLDVRPENVLVTRRVPRPDDDGPRWVATLIDFGLGVHLIQDTMWDVAHPSFSAYTAPELLSSSVSAATDWWSLGIIAAELATGGHPLLGLDPRNVTRQLAIVNFPPPDGLTDHLRALYDGLTAPAEVRWGAEHVAAWTQGTMPAAPPRASRPAPSAFVFQGEQFRHLPQLMARLQEHWAEAADVLFGPEEDRWDELAAWLPQFDRPGFAARSIIERLERLGQEPDPWPADARLLVLLRRADPSLTPRLYRGMRVDREAIPGLAHRALPGRLDHTEDREPDGFGTLCREVVDDLWHWSLLGELDGVAGGRGLAEVETRWCRLERRWLDLMDVLQSTGAPLLAHLMDLWERPPRAHLLRLAADEEFPRRLRAELERNREFIAAQLGEPLRSFEELAAMALPPAPARARRGLLRRESPQPAPDIAESVGLLVLHLVSAAVRIEVEHERARRDEAALTQTELSAAWQRRERWRELDRPVAMGWAAGAMGVVFVACAGLLIAGDTLPPLPWLPPTSDDAISLAWSWVLVCLAAQTASELWLAASIGAPYHRDYSLSTILLRLAGAAGERFGRGFWTAAAFLAAVLVVAAAVLAGLLVAPYALTVPVVIAHIWSTRRRYLSWTIEHGQSPTSTAGQQI